MANILLDELNQTYIIPAPGPVGHNRPFTRVYARSYANHRFLYREDNAARACGDGVRAGTHTNRHTEWGPHPINHARDVARRAIPSWVAVPYDPAVDAQLRTQAVTTPGAERPTYGGVEIDVEFARELQGPCTLSKQSWTDIPIYQWHHWYDWNFHVVPEPGFEYLRGWGNSGDVECEWDCGIMGDHDGGASGFNMAGPMVQSDSDAANVRRDWCWPMTGGYIWLAGRWIYDGGHPIEPDPTNARQDPTSIGRVHSELHPCMAVATTRSEAVMFPAGNDAIAANRAAPSAAPEVLVPAVQFMFYANRRGGYKAFTPAQFSEREFNFVVNLPPFPEPSPVFIGSTGQSMLVPREPILRVKIERDPFSNSAPPIGTIDPTVRLITEPTVPNTSSAERATRQALVTIPTSCLTGKDSYGVVVSLGWHNPDHIPGNRVYLVHVTLDTIRAPEFTLLKLGVNGRFFQRSVGDSGVVNLGESAIVSMLLAESDEIVLQIGGLHEEAVGNWMRQNQPQGSRTLSVNGSALTWSDVEGAPDVAEGALTQSITVDTIASAFVSMTWTTLGYENDDISIEDPANTPQQPHADQNHHVRRHHIEHMIPRGLDWDTLTRPEVIVTPDYTLNYTITIFRVPASGPT